MDNINRNRRYMDEGNPREKWYTCIYKAKSLVVRALNSDKKYNEEPKFSEQLDGYVEIRQAKCKFCNKKVESRYEA